MCYDSCVLIHDLRSSVKWATLTERTEHRVIFLLMYSSQFLVVHAFAS